MPTRRSELRLFSVAFRKVSIGGEKKTKQKEDEKLSISELATQVQWDI